MYLLKIRPTNSGFVHVWKKCQRLEHQSNSSNSSKFVWNCTQNCIYCLEIPLRHNVCRSRVRISRNIVIWMSQSFRIKSNQKSSRCSQCLSSHLIFCIKVGVEVNHIRCCVNTQRISRTILMQSRKMHQGQSSQQEWKLVMKAVETVQSGVISFLLFFLSLKRSDYIIRVQSMKACPNRAALLQRSRPDL